VPSDQWERFASFLDFVPRALWDFGSVFAELRRDEFWIGEDFLTANHTNFREWIRREEFEQEEREGRGGDFGIKAEPPPPKATAVKSFWLGG